MGDQPIRGNGASASIGRVSPDSESSYLDRMSYHAIHFYGFRLSDPLANAARYLRDLEERAERPLHVLCLRQEFSYSDAGTELAWQVTVVLGEPMLYF
jgi:hypothetical protein